MRQKNSNPLEYYVIKKDEHTKPTHYIFDEEQHKLVILSPHIAMVLDVENPHHFHQLQKHITPQTPEHIVSYIISSSRKLYETNVDQYFEHVKNALHYESLSNKDKDIFDQCIAPTIETFHAIYDMLNEYQNPEQINIKPKFAHYQSLINHGLATLQDVENVLKIPTRQLTPIVLEALTDWQLDETEVIK